MVRLNVALLFWHYGSACWLSLLPWVGCKKLHEDVARPQNPTAKQAASLSPSASLTLTGLSDAQDLLSILYGL